MGYVEIPDWMYENILRNEIAALIGLGFTPEEARHEALERMGRGFVARSTDHRPLFDDPLSNRFAWPGETQRDHDEYEEEMSLGGRPYRVPR